MSELVLLGSGAALNDGSREPAMLAMRGPHSTVLIDCGSNPLRSLQQLDIPLGSIEHLILTHSHVDHTAGFPLLILMLWMSGRHRPLPIHGPADTLSLAKRLLAQWDTSDWKGMAELEWHPTSLTEGADLAEGTDFELTASPGVHTVPVIAVRARDKLTGRIAVYSSDGEPSSSVQRLASGADLLVHEAGGNFPGHSTSEEAAHLARAAGVGKLLLMHVAGTDAELETRRAVAESILGGPVWVGRDLQRYEW
jgi:ribonuclease Z